MIPNYAYCGLPNYTKFMNSQISAVPPQQHFAQVQSSSSLPPSYIAPTQHFSNRTRFYSPSPYISETSAYRNNYKNSYNTNNYSSKTQPINNKNILENSHRNNIASEHICSKSTSSNRSESGNYEPVFNFLGINFYFDDILILCLLFFLYTEQANDFGLYLALIFLLMS